MCFTVMSGCVGPRDGAETIAAEFSELKELVLETIKDRIAALDEDYVFCSSILKGCLNWQDPHGMWQVDCAYPIFGVVMPDRTLKREFGEPFLLKDQRVGEKTIAALGKCTMDDAVSFGTVRDRIVRVAALTWIGDDGTSLAGFLVITSDGVYFIYTELGCYKDPPPIVADIFADPPYYLWRSPKVAQHIYLKDQKRVVDCMKRFYAKTRMMCLDREQEKDFFWRNSIVVFKIDVDAELFTWHEMAVDGVNVDDGGLAPLNVK